MSTDEAQDQGTTVLRFPQSRVLPSGHAEPTRYLGLGAMAKVIGAPNIRPQAIGAAAAEVSGTAIFWRSPAQNAATVTAERPTNGHKRTHR
ncbi:hypothetical protein [Mesorhizobium humile]|uniref:Uncharacterized protein n=1 Tax=Mesorhizobium humile TaxID=3072313 RepID=A0ABU4YKV0_9HYPH|nr:MULTISPECIES: hypothetical protein [unclassified Mesorhizobium]MDX8462390.1 hypothetical protein [Mesorhizobium sp. VK2D]MDX8487590.1 hypothetical protein [Mesorhizobium sp. VK2B]